MGFVVNNTTKFKLFDLVCPHSCRGCGCLGEVCCERCKNNMIKNRVVICPICKDILAKSGESVIKVGRSESIDLWKCENCKMMLKGLWVFGWREGVLEKLVEEYKYQSIRAMGGVLVDLFDEVLPRELRNVVVVPLPTIGRHVRERGFDHTLVLAKGLAKRRGWKCERVLGRAANTVQVGAKAADREAQAKKAYEVVGKVDKNKSYLLLDDVWTTGASMLAAEKVLRDAGADEVYAAALAVSRPKEAGEAGNN